jgi:hypothetical protein
MGLRGRCFTCLRPTPLPSYNPIVHKAGQKYKHDLLYPQSINSINTSKADI